MAVPSTLIRDHERSWHRQGIAMGLPWVAIGCRGAAMSMPSGCRETAMEPHGTP